MANLTEFEPPLGHFCSKGKFENRIDRIFWSVPSWVVKFVSLVTPAPLSPHNLNLKGIRDHIPIGFIMSGTVFTPPSSRPIPSFVTKHPLFSKTLRHDEGKYNLSYKSLSASAKGNAFKAMALYKYVVRKAAAHVRTHLLNVGTAEPAHDMILGTISRCFFKQNVQLAQTLMIQCPKVAQHIKINGSKIVLKDPPRFSDLVCKYRFFHFSNKIQDCESSLGSAPSAKRSALKSKLTYLSRLISKYVPINKYLCIAGSLDADTNVTSNQNSSIISALAQHWTSSLDGSNVTFDPEAAQSALQESVLANNAWDWSSLTLPTIGTFKHVIKNARDSAPGKDGNPYSAYRSSAVLLELLIDVFSCMREFPPLMMNLPTPPMDSIFLCNAAFPKRIMLK